MRRATRRIVAAPRRDSAATTRARRQSELDQRKPLDPTTRQRPAMIARLGPALALVLIEALLQHRTPPIARRATTRTACRATTARTRRLHALTPVAIAATARRARIIRRRVRTIRHPARAPR